MGSALENRLLAEKEFKEGKIKLESLPTCLTLYTTDTCNLRCIMCSIGQKTAPSITITPNGYQRLFDIFPYVTSIILSGAELFYDKGNPAGYVQKIFDEGYKYDHLKFSGLSNGTLINEDRARMVVDKFSWINVSLDTTDPQEYAKIRVGSNFNLVRRNLVNAGLKCPLFAGIKCPLIAGFTLRDFRVRGVPHPPLEKARTCLLCAFP